MKKLPKDAIKVNTVLNNNRDFAIGAAICIIALSVIGGIILSVSRQTRTTFHPTIACEIFTADKAKSLIQGDVINGTNVATQLSGDTAISKCAYSNVNEDVNKMIVAATTIRSAINDEGVAQNISEFTIASKSIDVTPVLNIGDDAFYNRLLGQMNILHNKQWIILSYGVGSAPEANSIDDAKRFAKLIITD